MSKNASNLCAYASFINGLNGRFGSYFRSTRQRVNDLTEISGPTNRSAKIILACGMLVSLLAVIYNAPDTARFVTQLRDSASGWIYLTLGKILFAVYFSVLLWRLWLYLRYKPVKACTDNELLPCTVIVPAYNEGRQVLHTLRSVVRSDIPADKLQIIAVDDGSKDDTWRWIQKAARQFPGRILTVQMAANSGKRRALHEGFLRSTGQVLVTIDSDSLIEPHTIRRLISPFSRQRRIGAVAGCVRVLNLHQGMIPRMLDVAFAFSFDFYRASQSRVNSVFCTPGALSAYRKKPLMDNLDRWLNQTFMGRLSTIGEDRAMTNFILKDGYYVTFQSDAVVYTNVPVGYKQLCRMLLRWARSNVRETLYMASFIFTRFRPVHQTAARVNFLVSAADVTIPRLLIAAAALLTFARPDVLAAQLILGALAAAAVQGTFYAVRRKSTDAIWAFGYSLFAAAALSWIAPYAIVTAANGNWLTRDLLGGNADTGTTAKPAHPAA